MATHVLKTSVGITVTIALTEESFRSEWSSNPSRLTKADREQLLKEYLDWRDEILGNFAKETGRKICVITL